MTKYCTGECPDGEAECCICCTKLDRVIEIAKDGATE